MRAPVMRLFPPILNSTRRRLALCLLVTLTLHPVHAAAPTAAGTATRFALAPSAEVGGEGVFLDQILSTLPASALPHLLVRPAPTLGQGITLSRAEVADWLAANAPDFASTNWAGPDRIRIARRGRTLDETELKELLRNTLQTNYVRDRGELELRLTRVWNPLLVPDDPIALRILDLPAAGPSSNFIVRFEMLSGEERLGTWHLAVTAKIWREVPVALVPLRRGQTLADAPIAMDRRDILSLRDVPGVFSLDDTSLEFVENVSAGHPVLARSVRARPVVHRGQLVAALVQDGPLSILLKVEALEDGLPGQVVRIRNPRTRRELKGKVVDEETIVIPW